MAACADVPNPVPKAASRRLADPWLNALACWYLTGIIAALGFSLGFHLLRPAPGTRSDRDLLDALTWMDGKWYKQIAVEGYRYDAKARSNAAFFPVYPLLGRAIIMATGLRAEAALLIVSNICFLAALALLAFYVRARYPEEAELGDYTVLVAALCPTERVSRIARLLPLSALSRFGR